MPLDMLIPSGAPVGEMPDHGDGFDRAGRGVCEGFGLRWRIQLTNWAISASMKIPPVSENVRTGIHHSTRRRLGLYQIPDLPDRRRMDWLR